MNPSVFVRNAPDTLPCVVILTPELVEALEVSAAARGVTDERELDAKMTGLMESFVELEQTGLLAAVNGRTPAVPAAGLPAMHCARTFEPDGMLTFLVVSLG